MSGVVYEEEHRIEPVENELPPELFSEPEADAFVMPPSNFSNQVDLWSQPWLSAEEAESGFANPGFGKGPASASFEKFQPRMVFHAEPVVTVQDRQVVLSLFELGTFQMRLNLKPAFANPDALMPTSINPGISGSFSF